jgi:hypothetical protein
MYLCLSFNKNHYYLSGYICNIEKKTNFALRFFSLNKENRIEKTVSNI